MKRSAIKRRPLADTVLDSLEAEDKEYRELDGSNLYFRVKPDGGKSWQLRYKNSAKKWAWLGLGGYPEVSGSLARKRAAEHREQISNGIDPQEQKRAAKVAAERAAERLFRVAAESWYDAKCQQGLAQSSLDKIRTYLDADILPELGDRQLDDISRTDCARLQMRIEDRGALNVAKKVRGWLNDIFGYAIAKGLTENDPASRLKSIAKPAPTPQQYPHLLEPELPDFIKALRRSNSRMIPRTAAWLCLWTASRPGMVRFAEWKEFDLDAALWTVPAAKMKMRRDQLIPLPRQAVEALREVQAMTGRTRWVFPGTGPKNPVISENTIGKVYALVGYKGRLVGHGTRHTASTLLNEHDFDGDLVEAQLAHKEEGTAGIYNQAAYLRQRREMMQWYADHLDALGDGRVLPSVGHRRLQ
ncbi:integrase arm-type DNA-binding domain-containing protein [Pseudomonas nicosulfuronedens]|uniref:tyrosine-type recombinase/integrase n=1 Tax=Pseudomonas nicosulfuronedens TaxID=2571105 RepID=UPI00244AB415|nr:integrase arm-type DNA-binding domain-containing protein [Pseudomonas nicosulfuronedens]MDH1012328.1 integrase arm-type DNA-binding domain-containing protein [Pseudomonas nicosulfuronedens]MDH2030497.1 integrase arm-type DNA-binding domain-containing protein [Pseudomonas nicosulfuronedens]